MGRHDLDLPVLERERLVFFVVQIELPHSEKQLVGVDAAREFYIFRCLFSSHSPLDTVGSSYRPVFTEERGSTLVQEGCWRENRVILETD